MGSTLHALRVLSHARWRIIVNSRWRGGIGKKLSLLVVALLAVITIAGIYLLSLGVLRLLLSPRLAAELARQNVPITPSALVAVVPSALMLALLTITVLSSIGSAISALFFANDLEFLLIAPIPVRSVFIAKLVESLLAQYLLLLFVAVTPLIAYGVALGYGVRYFVLLPLIVAATPLMPTALGALAAVLILRVVPSRRAREILGVLTSLVGFSFYFGAQFLGRNSLTRQVGGNAAWLTNLDQPYLPSAWAGRALRRVGAGDWVGLGYAALYVLVAMLVFFGGAVLTERFYHSGWLSVVSSGETRRLRKAVPQVRTTRQLGGWLGQAQAILHKDILVLPRDLRNLLQFVWPLAFVGFWLWRVISDSSVDVRDPLLILLSGVGVTFFVCSSISARLAQTGISREGRAYWLLHVAPINTRAIVWSKAVLAWLPYPGLGLLLMVVAVVVGQLNPLLGALGWLGVVGVGAGMTTIQTGLGAAFPVLNWEQPEKMVSMRAGCLGALLGWSYTLAMAALLGLASLPWTLPLLSATTQVSPLVWIAASVGLLVAVLLSVIALWLPVRMGADRLERIEG